MAVPTTPAEWKQYANSAEVAQIPQRKYYNLKKEASIVTTRDVYLDFADIVKDGNEQISAFADVIALQPHTVVDLTKTAIMVLTTRVLTADADVQLELVPSKTKATMLVIYADAAQDRKLSYSVRGTSFSGDLDWSADAYVGVEISFDKGSGEPWVEYVKDYRDQLEFDQFVGSLKTQLRIASALFWTRPAVAMAQTTYLVGATAKVPEEASLCYTNLQAASLGQQLAAQTVTGANASYAPVLSVDKYEKALGVLIGAAKAFEQQYDRFSDRTGDIKGRLEACGVMIEQAKDNAKTHGDFTQTALGKYNQAKGVMAQLQTEFQNDELELDHLKAQLTRGIKDWEFDQKLKAAFTIITAVIEFAAAITLLCVGAPAGPDVEKTVEAVKAAEEIAGEGKRLVADTLKKVADVAGTLVKLYPTVDQAVKALDILLQDPNADVTKISSIAGSAGDASAIGTLAAWDKWILDSDYQLEFAVDNKISGAEEYRLALRKHAINGKALAQAQAEAIKAGQEYLHAGLEEAQTVRDIARLQALQKEWEAEQKVDEEAEAMFYDRFMTLRTSIVIQMRNLTWAYRYEALRDSRVVLGVQKPTAEYATDLSTVLVEINDYLEQHPGGVSTLSESVFARDLPGAFAAGFLESLRTTGTATFSYLPSVTGLTDEAGPFDGGSHFRVVGLQVFLVGATVKARAKPGSSADFKLAISTSGLYADVQEGKVWQFASPPLVNRPFEYSVVDGKEKVHVDSIHAGDDYSAPTAFTRWTITVKNVGDLDLSTMTDVRFDWTAKFYAD